MTECRKYIVKSRPPGAIGRGTREHQRQVAQIRGGVFKLCEP
jgi:hypothetical protein